MQNKENLELLKKTYGSVRFRIAIQKLKTVPGESHKLVNISNLAFYTADPYITTITLRKSILECIKKKVKATSYFFE